MLERCSRSTSVAVGNSNRVTAMVTGIARIVFLRPNHRDHDLRCTIWFVGFIVLSEAVPRETGLFSVSAQKTADSPKWKAQRRPRPIRPIQIPRSRIRGQIEPTRNRSDKRRKRVVRPEAGSDAACHAGVWVQRTGWPQVNLSTNEQQLSQAEPRDRLAVELRRLAKPPPDNSRGHTDSV